MFLKRSSTSDIMLQLHKEHCFAEKQIFSSAFSPLSSVSVTFFKRVVVSPTSIEICGG